MDLFSFYNHAWIKREIIVPYNPQQNGITKWKNKFIEESVKAMVHDFDFLLFLRREASPKTMYIQNRSPRIVLEDMTPKEAFSKRKPEVGQLKIFGCLVYILVPKDKREKLEPSGRKSIFVGYNKSSKAYKIYILEQWRNEVRWDVTFDERMAYWKSKELSIDILDEVKQEDSR